MIAMYLKESAYLVGGLLSLILGWILIRVGVSVADTIRDAITMGCLGIVLLFCAKVLIWHFLSLM